MYQQVAHKDDEESLLPPKAISALEDRENKWWSTVRTRAVRTDKKRSFITIVISYRWLIDTSLLLIIIGLMSVLLRQNQLSTQLTPLWQVGGDFTAARLEFPTKIEKFDPDMSFVPMNSSEFFTDDTLAKWNTIMPKGTGFPGPGKIFATTSMTHQLHCVYMMARIFSGVVSNNIQAIPEDYHFHFMHCVDYIRQGIMCSADLAVEVHEPEDSDDFGPQDGGWSGHHVCKDYSKVISYLEREIQDGTRIILPIDD
ncbi:hypothetical protein P154DRAFT_605686 [Amniculicola lignicola CBS 123094]|uniref:Oxidase ustYa n=1 Tax=Amniculicola lignicola CBS 123094 TaxID=1392246 RepID=A0A6A5WEA3_9PLEO|nr:hypothetical protein P154DRAFT_605686 [Amniculicola lignicola CBS 123094]